jgi:hypothetical protein
LFGSLSDNAYYAHSESYDQHTKSHYFRITVLTDVGKVLRKLFSLSQSRLSNSFTQDRSPV